MLQAALLTPVVIPESWLPIAGSVRAVEALIEGMKRDWMIVLALTVIVIAAGAVSSLLQTKQEQSKLIVAGCGALSAAVTAFVGLVYPLSAREMNDRVDRALGEMRKASRYMETNELPAVEGRTAHLEKLLKHLENTEAIVMEGSKLASEPNDHASLLVRSAFAAEFDEFPRNDAYLYFVGTSVGESLEGARSDAIRLAQQEVQRAVLDQLPPSADSSSVAEAIGNTGSVADTVFSCKEGESAKVCTYSVLYTLKRQTVDFYLATSGVNRTDALRDIQKQATYYQQRWQAYAGALDFAREKLTPAEYGVLLEGRVARRAKDHAGCVRLLSASVRKENAGWYLGWLNLGLSYWSLGDVSKAREAFAQAASMEPSLPVRDASIYNTYGQFLVEQGEYSEAKLMLDKALEINPDITGARYAIKVAEARPERKPSAEMQGSVVQ